MISVDPLFAIFVVIILISINSFLASAEIALVSLNETHLKQKAEGGDKKAKHLLAMKRKPSDFLSTVQIGITLAGLLSGAFAADSLALLIVERFIGSNISDALLSTIKVVSVVIFTFILTYFMMVFGELVPKRIAIIHPYKTGNFVISPIMFFSKIMKPFVKLMSISTNGVLRIIGIDPNQFTRPVTEEEILLMMREGREQGTIEKTEEEIDNIIGVIYIKDLLKIYSVNKKHDSLSLIKDLMRRPFFVSETLSLVTLFNEMKQRNNQLAVVVDEYGGTSGIITIMDILEEIVGDLELPGSELIKSSDGGYIIDGRTEIDEVSKFLDIDLDSEINYTLSRFMIRKLGYVPSIGQTPEVVISGYMFRVQEISGSSIRSVYVKRYRKTVV